MDKTCCPLYTIRCDATNFRISSSQRRVVQKFNRFINENIKTKQKTETKGISSNNSLTVEQWLKTQPMNNAHRLILHILNEDTPPTDDFLNKIKSRQKRWAKKLLKIKSKNELSLKTDVRRLIKRFDRMKTSIDEIPLEKLLEFDEKPLNRFEMRLVRSFPPSKEFQETLRSSHEIYQRYQMSVHHDSKDECSFSQFKRFLCESSLDEKSSPAPSCGFGCFHLQYYLNGKIIGCSVIDILPQGVSSVYFYYDPDFSFLRLGVYSALRELELTRRLTREVPTIRFYYLGFYVHSCVKMRYKGQYEPSFLLCPETYTWHPIEKCRPLLNASKYVRFETDPNKVDENEEKNISNLKLRVRGRIITPDQLATMSSEYFSYIVDRFHIFAKLAGRPCASRMVIELN